MNRKIASLYMIPLMTIGLLSFIFLLFFRVAVVSGHSMDNSLKDGQHLILSVRAYDFCKLKRGDVIVAEPCTLKGQYIIKRLIGLPGDQIEIRDNRLYLNGEKIQEDYLPEPMITENIQLTVPEGRVFVMGDNRNLSKDSRNEYIGCLSISNELKGKIILCLPF